MYFHKCTSIKTTLKQNTPKTHQISKKIFRGGPKTAAKSKLEHFVIIVNGWKPLTIITKSSILIVAAVLDPQLVFGRALFHKQAVDRKSLDSSHFCNIYQPIGKCLIETLRLTKF